MFNNERLPGLLTEGRGFTAWTRLGIAGSFSQLTLVTARRPSPEAPPAQPKHATIGKFLFCALPL